MNRLQMQLIKDSQSGADEIARASAAAALAEAREPDVDQVARDALADYATLDALAQANDLSRFQATIQDDGSRLRIPAQTSLRLPFDQIKGDQPLSQFDPGVVNVAPYNPDNLDYDPGEGVYLLHFRFRNRASRDEFRAQLYINDSFAGFLYRGTPGQMGVASGTLLRYLSNDAQVWIELFLVGSADTEIFKGEIEFSGVKVADRW